MRTKKIERRRIASKRSLVTMWWCSYWMLHDVLLLRHPRWILHLEDHTHLHTNASKTSGNNTAQRSSRKATGNLKKKKKLKQLWWHNDISLLIITYLFMYSYSTVNETRVVSNLERRHRRHVRGHGCLSNHPVWNTICWWKESVDTEWFVNTVKADRVDYTV